MATAWEIHEESGRRLEQVERKTAALTEMVDNLPCCSSECLVAQALYHAQQVNALLDQAYAAHVDATQGKAA